MKRLICIILTVALLCGLCAVLPVSAAELDISSLRMIWDADTDTNYSIPYSQCTELTLSIVEGKGYQDSKALKFSVATDKESWANYAQIKYSDTDWTGVDYLYFYVREYTGNLNISLFDASTEYKLKNNVQNGVFRWNGTGWDSIKTGSQWNFCTIGTNYTGWIRIPMTSFAEAADNGGSGAQLPTGSMGNIRKIQFSVSGINEFPATAYFDCFMVSGGALQPENVPQGLQILWDLNDLTVGTNFINSYYAEQASLTAEVYEGSTALKWQNGSKMDWVDVQKVPLTAKDLTGASELWFWLDMSGYTGAGYLGVGIGDSSDVLFVPGKGDVYNYKAVAMYYYNEAGVKQTAALSSWGWMKALPAGYVGWAGVNLTDYAALMSDRKLDCTSVNTFTLKMDEAKGNYTGTVYIDNIGIRTNPNGLHTEDADKAKPAKITVTMPEDPATQRNFAWHTKGWANTDVQVVPAGETAPDFTAGNALTFTGAIIDNFAGYSVHQAKATGLTPGTEYAYRVGDAELDVWSDTGRFVTDDGDDGFSFTYVSDMQTGSAEAAMSLYTLKCAMDTAPQSEFFLNTGDVINNAGKNSEYMAVLDEAGFFAFGNMTLASVSGNHDYLDYSSGETAYIDNAFRDHYNFDYAEGCDPSTGEYYSFNYGNVHFIALNPNANLYSSLDSAQLNWLRADLASDAAKNAEFRIVYMHQGVYTTGPHYYYYQDILPLTAQLPSVFADGNVDLVLQGHDHVYALTYQIDRTGTPADSLYTDVISPLTGDTVSAMAQNEAPVYFIGGTAGTKYEPGLYYDEEKSLYTVPATSSYAADKYEIKPSQSALASYLDKFQFSGAVPMLHSRSQALFNVVSVSGNTLVVDTYTVDNQSTSGACAYYGSFALTNAEPVVVDPCEGYTDINRDLWYHSAVDYVIKNGYMGSTKTDGLTFEPNTKVSRAMVASIMYRIAEMPAVEYTGAFTDVKAGKWYTDAIEWAAQNGLAAGKGDGKFDPNGNVTRQELAVFMYKLADFLYRDVTAAADLGTFKDGSTVPSWAKSYMQWAVAAGLISGKGQKDGSTLLAPKDNATRAEFASIIMRFMGIPAIKNKPVELRTSVSVWDMENIPDEMTPWAADKYVELWGSDNIGVTYGKWKPSGVDGMGFDGSRALGWTTYEHTWGNNTFIALGNDNSARTDWTGASRLYFYIDISGVSVGGTMPVDVTLSTAVNGAMEMTEGATWYYFADGEWQDSKINEWKHMLVPAGFKGWICLPLTDIFGAACDVRDVQRIGFLTEHNMAGGTVYFDEFRIDKCDAVLSYDPAALRASKTDIDLTPDTTGYDSADYFCTWGPQGSTCGGTVTVRDVLNDEALFGENGWAYSYPEEIRKNLRIVLDDGWDLPRSENGTDNDAYYGSFILDEEKFPNYGETYPERLKTLSDKFRAAGWMGVGVWICCQEDAAHITGAYNPDYWAERIEWCRYAGISYWKIDWGKYCYDLSWRMLITDQASRIYPELIIEHISGDVGTNDPLGTGTCSPKLTAMKNVAAFSDVFRTYDVTTQLSFSSTMERVAGLLKSVSVYRGSQLGLMNCEDELYLAASLGLSGGIMRSRAGGASNLDEAARMVVWHRIAPSFEMTANPVKVSETTLSDVWSFTNDTWDSSIQNRTVTQYAPAAVSRGIDLPAVTSDGEVPYLTASRNAVTGAISVGAFRRTSAGSKNHLVFADVSLNVGELTGDIGIFGVYRSLTLTFAGRIEGKRILAQDLIGSKAFDITGFVNVSGNRLTIAGDLLKAIGTDGASLNDTSEPALLLRIGEPSDYAENTPAAGQRVEGPSCAVTLPTAEFCTVAGAQSAAFSSDYTFTVTAKNGFRQSDIVVKANGIRLNGTDGAYILPCVMSAQKITVEYAESFS